MKQSNISYLLKRQPFLSEITRWMTSDIRKWLLPDRDRSGVCSSENYQQQSFLAYLLADPPKAGCALKLKRLSLAHRHWIAPRRRQIVRRGAHAGHPPVLVTL